MIEVYKINIGRKDLYSKNYNLVERTDYENRYKVNISVSLIEIFSILLKENR